MIFQIWVRFRQEHPVANSRTFPPRSLENPQLLRQLRRAAATLLFDPDAGLTACELQKALTIPALIKCADAFLLAGREDLARQLPRFACRTTPGLWQSREAHDLLSQAQGNQQPDTEERPHICSTQAVRSGLAELKFNFGYRMLFRAA